MGHHHIGGEDGAVGQLTQPGEAVVTQQDGEQRLGRWASAGWRGAGGHLHQRRGETLAVAAGDPGGLIGQVLLALQAGQFPGDDRSLDAAERAVEADGAVEGGGGVEVGGRFGVGWGVGLGVGTLRPIVEHPHGLGVAQPGALLDQDVSSRGTGDDAVVGRPGRAGRRDPSTPDLR